MPRVKKGMTKRARHKKVLKLAKGYWGRKSKTFRAANETVLKGLWYSYRDRRVVKREFRKLWIARINAAARNSGLTYSRFMNGLRRAGVEVNRKMLADMAVHDSEAFDRLVERAKNSLA